MPVQTLPLLADSLVIVHSLPLAAKDPTLVLDLTILRDIYAGASSWSCSKFG